MSAGSVAVVALVRDLMDRSRFAVLREAGTEVTFVRSVADLVGALAGDGPADAPAAEPDVVVVVDLGAPDALDAVAAAAASPRSRRTVAFGAHVDRGPLDAAHVAGAEVMARSAFFDRLGGLAD